MIFYQGRTRQLLSEFKGARLDIGAAGSGTRLLALALLKANGIEPGGEAGFVEVDAKDPLAALEQKQIDAIFVMGDSTASDVLRKLLRTEDVHLFDVTQADAYVRRIGYLNKLVLPRGSLDFGKNIPPEDVHLIGPTVELVARDSLHPALSDLLLEAAREVHGGPGLFRKRGEFPAPLEHEFRLSPDATRYYASGKTFLYRTFPFWVASLIARTLAVLVPIVLLLIPGHPHRARPVSLAHRIADSPLVQGAARPGTGSAEIKRSGASCGTAEKARRHRSQRQPHRGAGILRRPVLRLARTCHLRPQKPARQGSAGGQQGY